MPKHTREESLLEADRVGAAQAEATQPSEADKACIKSYVEVSQKCKKVVAAAKEALKDVKPVVKQLRANVLEALKAGPEEVVAIPAAVRKEADARAAAAGLPAVPPYVRLMKNTKDLAITADVINEAFAAITEEDVLDAEGEGGDALINAVMASVRRIVRSFNEQAKLTDALPRGVKAAEVPLAAETLCVEAVRLHEHSARVLVTERKKREDLGAVKAELMAREAAIDAFLNQNDKSTQKVIVGGQPHVICRRTTLTRPKVTFKVLQDFLEDGIKECDLGGTSASGKPKNKASKADAAATLKRACATLQRAVLTRFGTMESTSKTAIHLQRCGGAREKALEQA